MQETSLSLLDRLRDTQDQDAWRRLFDLYSGLIRAWVMRSGATASDADDLTQDVLQVVVKRMPDFRRQRTGSFRAWLRQIAWHCLQEHWRTARRTPNAAGGDSRADDLLRELADPNSGMSREWDLEHDRHVASKLLELIRPRFEATTWTAFRRVAIDGVSPDQVAAELGVTVNVIFISKSRVLSQLRREAQGLLD